MDREFNSQAKRNHSMEAARRVHRALGDEGRIRIVQRIVQSPASVSEIVTATGLSSPLVSWHLRKLRVAKLISQERLGRETISTLDPNTLAAAHALILQQLGISQAEAWLAPAEAIKTSETTIGRQQLTDLD